MKLPREIRDHIYRLLVAPLYRTGLTNRESELVHIAIKKHRFHRTKNNEASYQRKLEKEARHTKRYHPEKFPKILSAQKLAEKKARYYKREAERDHDKAPHPTRTQNYSISREFDVMKYGNSLRGEIDWLFLDFVRNLSNVSCGMRKEIMNVVWNRRAITECFDLDALRWDNTDCAQKAFLKDRPSIWAGIKRIKTEIDRYCDFWPKSIDEQKAEAFGQMCDFVSKSLKLESFEFTLQIREDNVAELSKGVGSLAFLKKLRILNVAKNFDLHLHFYISFTGNDQEDGEYQDELTRKYHPLIFDLLQPDTLRLYSGPTTREESYLQSRPALL
jgi:hypothetical protein